MQDASDEQRLRARQERSLPVLAALRQWLVRRCQRCRPK